jgi:O-antigen ligase
VPSIPSITVPSRRLAALRPAELARIGGFALAVLAIELVLAKGAAAPEIPKYVLGFLGLFAVAVVFRFPMATALVFLALTDFIFYPTYFAYQAGSISVRPHEVALACLLMVAVVRPKRRTWGGAAGGGLLAFLLLLGLSAAFAVSDGHTTVTEAWNWGRPLFPLVLFWVVVRLFPSAEERRVLLTGAVILAAIAGIVALFVSLGAGIGHDLQEEGGNTINEGETAGSSIRVRLAGLSAAYALFWFSFVQIATQIGRRRLLWGLAMAGMVLGIAVSLNRNMWIGIVLGLILMAVVGGGMVRNRLAIGIVVAIGGVALLLSVGGSNTQSHVIQPIVKRGETLLSPEKTSQENSLLSRDLETSKAWKVAQNHLVIGLGAGVPFGVFIYEPVMISGLTIGIQAVPQLFLHNQYLYLILVAGVPGLIAFLIFLGVPLFKAVTRRPRDPFIAALGVGLALIMISAVVAIYFTSVDMTAILGLLTGVIVADADGRAKEKRSSGLGGRRRQLPA